MLKETELEDMPEALEQFVETCELRKSDATEWLVFHSYLIDDNSGRCGISPPMLALTWDMAKVVFNSLLEEALENMSRNYDRAFFARMENSPEQLRVGVFPKMGEGFPIEAIMLMDRRCLTMELYDKFYVQHNTGEMVTKEMRDPCNPADKPKAILH
ncbi:hypothetical protein ACVOZ6_003486 [Escherichia coli]